MSAYKNEFLIDGKAGSPLQQKQVMVNRLMRRCECRQGKSKEAFPRSLFITDTI